MIARRHFLTLFGGLAVAATPFVTAAPARARPPMRVHRDPSCGCCEAWVAHVKRAGFDARIEVSEDIDAVKQRLGVPASLASCHTAEIDGYLLEGHVPAEIVARLLAERPAIRGLAVPGMPVGSPGMETPGMAPEPFQVIAFAANGRTSVFADFPRGWGG
ncbi:MAG: DUF411 domain-containing protein [Hyphomicrobiaceae bacterium]|nr:DUF411 domain-containing protein [Hyphomicrobiaceae bacterium]